MQNAKCHCIGSGQWKEAPGKVLRHPPLLCGAAWVLAPATPRHRGLKGPTAGAAAPSHKGRRAVCQDGPSA